MTATFLTCLAYAIGGVATLIGFLAMIFPEKMSEGFGIPIDGLGVHYVRALGVRDVFVGAVALLLGNAALWSQLGYVCIAIATVAASDFYTVLKYGRRLASLAHLAGCLLGLGFSVLFFKI